MQQAFTYTFLEHDHFAALTDQTQQATTLSNRIQHKITYTGHRPFFQQVLAYSDI